MWVVYEHKNKSNGKVYVGITGQKPEKRWGSKGKGYKNIAFYYAIEKYGWDGFEHNILFSDLTKAEAEQKEIELVKLYKEQNRSYNVASGGNVTTGLIMSEKARKNISDGHKGLHQSEETKHKIGLANSLRSKELRIQISKKLMKPILQYDMDGNFIKEWDSAKSVENELGFLHQNISKCCSGKIRFYKQYIWKYKYE